MSDAVGGPDRLARFLAARRGVSFDASPLGCGALVSDWLGETAGLDAGAALRCRPRAAMLDARRGRLALLAVGWASRLGLAPADPPGRGDVGVIAGAPDVLGVCLGEGWAFQARAGLAFVARPLVVRAWSCPRP